MRCPNRRRKKKLYEKYVNPASRQSRSDAAVEGELVDANWKKIKTPEITFSFPGEKEERKLDRKQRRYLQRKLKQLKKRNPFSEGEPEGEPEENPDGEPEKEDSSAPLPDGSPLEDSLLEALEDVGLSETSGDLPETSEIKDSSTLSQKDEDEKSSCDEPSDRKSDYGDEAVER